MQLLPHSVSPSGFAPKPARVVLNQGTGERKEWPMANRLSRWIFASIPGIALVGCITVGPTPPPGSTSPPTNPPSVGAPPPTGVPGDPGNQADPLDNLYGGNAPPDPAGQSQSGSTLSPVNRVQTALESMVMGAALGSTFGPIGMAAGAGTALIYGALTGNVPFAGSRSGGGGGYGTSSSERQREDAIESQLDGQLARGDALEGEIEAELRRQEQLLDELERQETLRNASQAAVASPITDEELERRVDPRSAPLAPQDRSLPSAIF